MGGVATGSDGRIPYHSPRFTALKHKSGQTHFTALKYESKKQESYDVKSGQYMADFYMGPDAECS